VQHSDDFFAFWAEIRPKFVRNSSEICPKFVRNARMRIYPKHFRPKWSFVESIPDGLGGGRAEGGRQEVGEARDAAAQQGQRVLVQRDVHGSGAGDTV
jgi:hypothetical protein